MRMVAQSGLISLDSIIGRNGLITDYGGSLKRKGWLPQPEGVTVG